VKLGGKLLVMALLLGSLPASATSHPVPKDRGTLTNRDWLPHVISKLAPLEWWSFAASPSDIRREDFPGDFSYNLAKQDTWEFPRFCFSLFRPKPEVMRSLMAAVNDYKGDVTWTMLDGCIAAFISKPGFYAPILTAEEQKRLEELARNGNPLAAVPFATDEQRRKFEEDLVRNPPHADPEFVKRAISDAPRFATYIEQRLGLAGKPSLDFDPQWLLREGLAASRPQFEDYWEPGDRSVFLARDPQEYARTSKPTSPADLNLVLGVGMFEEDALLAELGADWESYQRSGMNGALVSAYPLLSRLADISDDALYEPGEVDALLAECLQAQDKVKEPLAIRGLDNLVRIARWAQKLQVGIYLGGQ
jgi:hypothetical protein